MKEIIALLRHATARERVTRAVITAGRGVPHFAVCFVDSWAELLAELRRSPRAIALVDPGTCSPRDVAQLAALHAELPSVYLLPYGDFREARCDAVLRLASLGVRQVITLNDDDQPGALQRCVDRAEYEQTSEGVFAALCEVAPPHLVAIIRALVADVAMVHRPCDLAQACCCGPKALRERLRASGLPSPSKLIAWVRLLIAIDLLAAGRSVQSVASLLCHIWVLQSTRRSDGGLTSSGSRAPFVGRAAQQRPPMRSKRGSPSAAANGQYEN